MYLSLYLWGFEKVTRGLRVRGSWRPNRTATFWPLLLWPSALCLSRSPGLLNWRSRGPLCWVMAFFTASCQHLHRTSTHQGPKALRPGVAFPTTSVPSPSPTLTVTNLPSVLTELYNSSTPTQSPTRYLESHVGSSFSGNNCHAVQRSLSSGASVYECTMGISLPRPISSANFRPRDFLS